MMDDEEALRNTRELAVLQNSVTKCIVPAMAPRQSRSIQSAKASGRVFDAVLLDLTVSGGMGGIEAAARLKQMDPAVKLIVSSGYSDASIMSNFREYGFEDVIPKPWQVAKVSEVFRRVLVTDSAKNTA